MRPFLQSLFKIIFHFKVQFSYFGNHYWNHCWVSSITLIFPSANMYFCWYFPPTIIRFVNGSLLKNWKNFLIWKWGILENLTSNSCSFARMLYDTASKPVGNLISNYVNLLPKTMKSGYFLLRFVTLPETKWHFANIGIFCLPVTIQKHWFCYSCSNKCWHK